ncbi:MAG: BTAD domain-containing putative transcriptional regulator [Candidatus Promineifilaceae bacterium]
MQPDDHHSRLSVFCLGSMRVFRDGKYITEAEWGQTKGPTQKIKALFAYLLAKGARGATKDAIVELLWGDQFVYDKSNSRFHAAIYYLRRAMEPDLPSRNESRYVVYENGFYKLVSPGGMWVDADAFENYYQAAQRLEEEGQEDRSARFWKMGEALYKGDYMIDLKTCYTEEYIDDCCKWRRYRLKEMHLTVLLKLAHYHFRCNQDHLSLTYAQKALDQDRGGEEAHRLVMRLMHRAGQPHDLIRQYRLCVHSLAESENRHPSPVTVQLYQQLLQTFHKW